MSLKPAAQEVTPAPLNKTLKIMAQQKRIQEILGMPIPKSQPGRKWLLISTQIRLVGTTPMPASNCHKCEAEMSSAKKRPPESVERWFHNVRSKLGEIMGEMRSGPADLYGSKSITYDY